MEMINPIPLSLSSLTPLPLIIFSSTWPQPLNFRVILKNYTISGFSKNLILWTPPLIHSAHLLEFCQSGNSVTLSSSPRHCCHHLFRVVIPYVLTSLLTQFRSHSSSLKSLPCKHLYLPHHSLRLVGQNPNSKVELSCFHIWITNWYWWKTHNHAVVDTAGVHQYLVLPSYLNIWISTYSSLDVVRWGMDWQQKWWCVTTGLSQWKPPVTLSRSLSLVFSILEAKCLNIEILWLNCIPPKFMFWSKF